MANQFDANIPDSGEKIAFKRAQNTQASSSGSSNTSGVLVIDPNMVFDSSGKLVDRYVKQEDMVMYCNLRIYKKPEMVVSDKNGSRTVESNTAPIEINLLNPLKSKTNQSYNLKNYFTTNWTDFFTSDAANNPTDDAYILDPETFGISSIDYTVNANQVPIVVIKFIDIQGRMLFERGNDPNNPYNIFFTIPYPKFLLTFKGYYGKAIEVQLVFLRANTRFDPSTGNYELTVEFQSDVFSLLQSFVTIYPYVAPYMFLMDDGVYLGQKILNSLYDDQNKDIANALGSNQTELDKYTITSNPTLFDLATALTKIPFNTLGTNGQLNTTSLNNDKILGIKTSFDNIANGITTIFNNKSFYLLTSSTKTNSINNYTTYETYKPINDSYKLSTTKLNEYLDALKQFNDNVKQIQSMNTTQNNFTNNIKKRINENVLLKDVINNFDINNALTNNLFYFDGNDSLYTLIYFNELVNIIINETSKVEAVIEEQYVDTAISDIGKVLGYQPNLGNILRIISNNMQTFLILMEIISVNAVKQLQSDNNRVRKHILNTTYKSNSTNTVKYYSPFPYYYKTINDGTNSKQVLSYPGADISNESWFEVAFVEEIYNALTVLKNKVSPSGNASLFGTKKTGISTIFALGEVDLTAYENKNMANNILPEMLFKYMLHSSYSGFFYRGMTIDNLTNHYSANMAQFEMDLLDDLIFSKMSSGSKYLTTNSINNAFAINTATTNLGSFGRSYLRMKSPADTYKSIITKSINEINQYKKLYSVSDVQNIINDKKQFVLLNINNTGLYNTLFNETLIPNAYSLTNSSKSTPLLIYAGLFPNSFYYCDVNTGNSLSDINTGLKNVDSSNTDTNSFQGLIKELNSKLNGIDINTDFNSNITYGKSTVPALTFSNLTTEKTNAENFNIISKPTVNVVNKYKRVLQ